MQSSATSARASQVGAGANKPASQRKKSLWSRFWRTLGPGLITGASDDDPSGIATYAQAGARFGFSITWTLLFTYPLMAAIQEISARIGRTTGRGLAGNLRRHYPNWVLQGTVALLLVANIINIGADLAAMGDATSLLVGGPRNLYVVLFAAACAGLQVFAEYSRFVAVLKWTTLSLFTYFGTVLVVEVPWAEAARGFLIPTFRADTGFWTTVVAVLGTTISPYLFFWQASQEVDEIADVPARKPLLKSPDQEEQAISRIKLDTYLGMGISNLVGLAIMVTTAATLHAAGITEVESSAQVVQALQPVAGDFAFAIFALGIIGTGLLAVPVLAGSAAYAIAEARGWPVGLTKKPARAKAFYLTIVVATLAGTIACLSPLDPIKALFWSAVINGVVAVPVMAMMMVMTSNRKVMGEFVVTGWLRVIGWIATAVMAAAAVGVAIAAGV